MLSYDYSPPPSKNSMDEIIIMYILQDNFFKPLISIDLRAHGENPWTPYQTKR